MHAAQPPGSLRGTHEVPRPARTSDRARLERNTGWGSSRRSGHFPNGVFRPERVGNPQCAFGIVPPFSVDHEPVMVNPRWQVHARPPNPLSRFLHRDRLLLPMSEISDQQHAQCAGTLKSKSLLCHSAMHISIVGPDRKKPRHGSPGTRNPAHLVVVGARRPVRAQACSRCRPRAPTGRDLDFHRQPPPLEAGNGVGFKGRCSEDP